MILPCPSASDSVERWAITFDKLFRFDGECLSAVKTKQRIDRTVSDRRKCKLITNWLALPEETSKTLLNTEIVEKKILIIFL